MLFSELLGLDYEPDSEYLHANGTRQRLTRTRLRSRQRQGTRIRVAVGEDKSVTIPETHPLRVFFQERVQEHFHHELGLRDQEMQSYVANVLTDFCDGDQLYKIRDATGRPLHDVGEMLIESEPVYGPAPSFDRERQVRKHIGDYTLFFAGMFPESINHLRLRRHRLENFVEWMKAGKESYFIVSTFEHFEYAKVAPLFARLSHEFEACVYGLNRVKNDLRERRYAIVKKAEELIM